MQTIVDVQIKKTTSNTVASYSLPLNEEVQYKIYNSSGKLVFSKSIILINTNSKVLEDLDVSHLPQGFYLLDISTGNKLIKQINITI
jgi:hypothetical protein